MDIERVREFITVVDRGGFGAAARMLNLTQPVISRHIRSLEDELGVTLLTRDATGVKCTLAGRVFLSDALKIVSAGEAARSHLERMRTSKVMDLLIETFVGYKPTDDLADALEQKLIESGTYAAVHTSDITVTDPIEDVLAGTCDIALVGHKAGLEVKGVLFEPIITEPFVCIVPSTHALADLNRIKASDLEGRTVYISDVSFKYQNLCIRELFAERSVTPHYEIRDWASSMDLYTRIAEIGDGATVIYASEARYSISTIRGGIKVLHFDDEGFGSTVSAVYKETPDNPAVLPAIASIRDVISAADMTQYWK